MHGYNNYYFADVLLLIHVDSGGVTSEIIHLHKMGEVGLAQMQDTQVAHVNM